MKMEDNETSEREKEVKEFLQSKADVKGLVDSGITKLPRIFIHSLPQKYCTATAKINHDDDHNDILQVPVIDLEGLADVDDQSRRKEIVEDIENAAGKWGFFQIINHGIPLSVMEDMLEATRRFHELPKEVKNEWYSIDFAHNNVSFFSNPRFRPERPGDWRDTLRCSAVENERNMEAVPQACREELKEYYKALVGIRKILGELLSEALGLSSDYITNAGCLNSMSLFCQYYPVCPEPHLTLGSTKHADSSFFTIVLQDTTGGLQVLHQNHWIDVKPVRGAFLVNIGDLMQLLSNDKMKSVEHRVLATQGVKARVSVACFFNSDDKLKPYGPIKELLSENNPPLYKDTNYIEFATHYQGDGFYTTSLPHFRLA
ncbi:1-aminocyclopropane-1-carboxylate oxidase homolog 1-like [Ziziphus jujuba]|uniref:1-aminocyclopropane-1-carboxylate oxidase homolog 1-like n=1 Tax=Ziziphus jujuba TaxID=326968 RepID=A0ABM3IEN0_ZIZJJ|nr:1-aminocyclopropane-1-carboxylate oxidase homolog 1-like [Ziziphus jujuba]